jgi:hypothetical protein
MGALVFVCPVTDLEVLTGIEMDSETFKSLFDETLRCPHCQRLHQVGGIRAWLTPAEDVAFPDSQVA